MNGLGKKWVKGPRNVVGNTDAKGTFKPRLGKGGGPVVEQSVERVHFPKEAS